MRRPLFIAGMSTLITIAAAGCAANPAPVPVVGTNAELSALRGQWDGEYTSAETGRSGSITFRLVAGGDSAYGDVVMVPAGSTQPLVRAGRPGAPGLDPAQRATASQVLTIRFVRVAHDSVSGALEPYQGPDCGCVLTTEFVGRVHGDRIEGSFVTRGAGGPAGQTGRWAVRRRRS